MEKRYIKKLFSLLVMALAILSSAYAQEKDVVVEELTAKVLDTNNRPVANAVVSSFVGKDKAIADEKGIFKIKVAASVTDYLYIEEIGYQPATVEVAYGKLKEETITLSELHAIDGEQELSFPYSRIVSNRSVSATTVIRGEELKSYPSYDFLEALSGRVPGMQVVQSNSMPGYESTGVAIRGVSAVVYIDGVVRSASDLSVDEVETVYVLRDLSGRAMLGLSGTNPVIWIETKKGSSYKKQISASASVGMNEPTGLPKYLDAYDYASLVNEARANDGLSPRYSQAALDAYQNNSDPVRFPNIDYQNEYVKKSAMYRRANVNFSGGDKNVNYFSMLDYAGSDGLEKVGQDIKYNRYKVRGNVNIRLNDWMKMKVNLSAVYGKHRFANDGNGADVYNMFYDLSTLPSNAHPISYDDKLIISDDYPTNLTNELMYGGYAESADLNTQNSAELLIDLGSVLEGLTFKASTALDVANQITNNKGGSAALYRIVYNNGEIGTERMVEEYLDPTLSEGDDFYLRRTSFSGQFNYDRVFGEHALTLDASYFQLMEEVRNVDPNYQPVKNQDIGFRANYAYNDKYVAQLDLSYTGSMFLQKGDRFGLYPTLGAAWIVSNEDFMADSKTINYLKLYSSFGYMGIDYVGLYGFNSYYLFETLWQNSGSWQAGVEGNKGASVNIYNIMQQGTNSFKLPTLRFFNVGIQSQWLDNKLAVELNYYNRNESDLFSQKLNETPTLYGGSTFLPASNYGENQYWGLDGMIQYTDKIGDFHYSIGANATYNRGKAVVVDEPETLEDYRKRAGTQMDNLWGYTASGLFQNESEITSRDVTQSWGAVQPGDIRYEDYNNDKVVDEKDIHDLGEHRPRIYYGLNLNLEYKGVGLKMIGTGTADGKMLMSSYDYFTIQGTTQNYSKPMLDRWPVTDSYPRLTTQSQNNYQQSSFWLTSASYFTMKNVELSYTFPKRVAQKLLMSNLKVFAQGKNLFTTSSLSKYGINPENPYAGSFFYPMFKTMSVGVSCKF